MSNKLLIRTYFEGCVSGLNRLDGGNYTTTELFVIALELTQKYFYHFPGLQYDLQEFVNEIQK